MKLKEILIITLTLAISVVITILINKSLHNEPIIVSLGVEWNKPLIAILILITMFVLIFCLYFQTKGEKQNDTSQL